MRLLAQKGYTVKVVNNNNGSAADVVLPTKGGSLAFLIHAANGTGALAHLAGRAELASRSARRTTILSTGCEPSALEDLQVRCPAGVNVVGAGSNEEAVEFMLACAQRMAAAAEPSARHVESAHYRAMELATAHLARVWEQDEHNVGFLLSVRPLSALARVRSEGDWDRLRHETHGLVDERLLYLAIDWLQRDRPAIA